jgi:hypothetical protein
MAHRIAGADEAAHRLRLAAVGGVIARGSDMDFDGIGGSEARQQAKDETESDQGFHSHKLWMVRISS